MFVLAVKQRGFTLLEMILVVFIMGTLATVSLSFLQDEDHHQRFADTRQRLQAIQHAVLGDRMTTTPRDRLMMGYTVDNGLLPASIDDLLGDPKPTNFQDYGLHSPVFDASPDASTGLNDGVGETELGQLGEQLYKGYRLGGYLAAPPATKLTYGDGWGEGSGAPNYGWNVNTSAGVLSVASLGADRAVGGSDYNADLSIDIHAGDWQVDIAGWQVMLINVTGADIPQDTSKQVGLSLLVYQNDGDAVNDYNWRRLSTNLITCIDGDGDASVNGTACAPAVVTFQSVGGLSTLVPQGRHLLVLIEDTNGIPHDGIGDQLCTTDCGIAARLSYQVTLQARALLPVLEVVITP